MFPAETKGEWEPVKIRERTQASDEDVEMGGTEEGAKKDEEPLWEEDVESDEDAVYPLRGELCE